ncbi:hypothetical protein [Aureivirga sp. CE67]|uniref:hypothetical protein n=1 Tax=Aureivirga sp. CE67 TaxID=1788983 RepID=UPI0018C8FA6A|nr:hypothetical protein [Aureivirga sp. CE67]
MSYQNLEKINKIIGWILFVGITIFLSVILISSFNHGAMGLYYFFIMGILFLPSLITGIVSVINRKGDAKRLKNGVVLAIIFQVGFPLILPLFFGPAAIFLSMFGAILGLTMWFIRRKTELQLLILNGIGLVVFLLTVIEKL